MAANKLLLLMISVKNIFRSYIPAIFWWTLVLALICIPGKELPKLGSWTDFISLDKIIHFLLFGLMAYLFMRPFAFSEHSVDDKKKHFLKLAVALSLWGLTTEFIQHFFISGRSLDIFDFVADTAGCFAAYIYCKNYFLK